MDHGPGLATPRAEPLGRAASGLRIPDTDDASRDVRTPAPEGDSASENNTQRYVRVKNVFMEAVSLAPSARPDALSRLCGGDAGLRAEVESLLRHHDEAVGEDR